MMQSDDIKELAAALAKAQGEIKNASLNKTNPHFRSKYADLAGVRDATTPHLSKNGLSITQLPDFREGLFGLVTKVLHSSGQWLDGFFPLPTDWSKPQAIGSAMTYARRYCWSAACGIAAEEDDDGNEAQKQAPQVGTNRAAAAPSPSERQPSAAPGISHADWMIAEIGKHTSVDSLNAWVKTQTVGYTRLSKHEQDRVHRATDAKRTALSRPPDDLPFDAPREAAE